MRQKHSLVFLLLVTLFSICSAQTKRDSLLQALSMAPNDTAKVWLLHDVSMSYMMISADSMITFLEQALDLSRELGFTTGEMGSLHLLSIRYQFKGDKIKERALTREALKLAKEAQAKSWLAKIYNHMGQIYFSMLSFDSAYQAYIEAEKIEKSLGNDYILWESKLNLFQLFATQEQYEKAEQYLEDAYEITKAKGIRMDHGWVLSNRTSHYFHRKDWEKYSQATEEYLEFLNQRKTPVQSNVYHKILFDYTDENPQEIIQELESIIPFHRASKNYQSLIQTYNYIGKINRRQKNYPGAIRAFEKALSIANENNFITPGAGYIREIALTYEEAEEQAKAYPYLKKYHHLVDSLNSIEIQKNLSELELKYQTAQKDKALVEKELALVSSRRGKQIFTISTIAGAIIALVALWFLYFKSRTNRLLHTQNIVIEKSLEEKEFLLKEIHHRVKNNLQVISSLLNWQSRYIEDDKALESMQEGRNRVQSMALIHQNLYQTENLTGVEVSDYIDKLSNSLFNSYNIKDDQIQFHSQIEPLNLDVDTLIPLGLILNELLSNALKYAFPGGRKGEIRITLHREAESLLLEVKDNGIGMPVRQEKKKKDSFGYKLIEAFAEKLKAQLQIESKEGTCVRLLIKNFKMI